MTHDTEQMISILLPVYNGAQYLAQQLDSLLMQSHAHWHCFIRDDGSSDASQEIIEKYCTQYPEKFVEIRDAQGNLGVIGSLNLLSSFVNTPYFALCDQDDVWRPNRLERTLAAMRSIEETGQRPVLAYSDLELVGATLEPISPSFWHHTKLKEFAMDLRCLPVFNAFTGCTMLGNRALLSAAFPVPKQAPMHDYWIAMVAKYGGLTVAVEEALIRYRQHGNNQCGAQVAPRLWQRAVTRFRDLPGFFQQAKRLQHGRLALLQELATRVAAVRTCNAYHEAVAAERGSMLARMAFLLRNRIPPSRAFLYWLA